MPLNPAHWTKINSRNWTSLISQELLDRTESMRRHPVPKKTRCETLSGEQDQIPEWPETEGATNSAEATEVCVTRKDTQCSQRHVVLCADAAWFHVTACSAAFHNACSHTFNIRSRWCVSMSVCGVLVTWFFVPLQRFESFISNNEKLCKV